jgi:Zn ribbon nucleic-acid-binding protein
MPDYKNGKIYKIWSPQGDEIYIGSTIQPLYKRFHHHKTKSPTCSSKILFEKYDDVRIELIECVPCDNKEQLIRREGEFIRNNNCVNRCIAGRTSKEYQEDNKEHYKEWRENNKDKLNEYDKEYKKNNKEKIKEYNGKKITCECGRTFRISDKARHERTKVHQAFICASAGNGEASISVPTNPGKNVTDTPGA